eukprot:g63715.t1
MWPFTSKKQGSGNFAQKYTPEVKDEESEDSNSNNEQPSSTVVGHGFDPRALERGAKAIKEIDASPNSKAALELAMQQEKTREAEKREAIEAYKVQQMNEESRKIQTMQEENRKTMAERAKHEQAMATHQAKLQHQLNQKKEEAERRLLEERLQRENSQFAQQQEAMMRNQAAIEAEKRKTIQMELDAKTEIARARAQAEMEGRIKEFRENEDVHIRVEKAKQAELRLTELETLRERWKYLSHFGTAVREIMTDPKKMTVVVGSLSLLALGVYSARSTTAVAEKFLISRIGKPSLVRETSRWVPTQPIKSLRRKFANPLSFFRKNTETPLDTLMRGMVFPHELQTRLNWVTTATIHTKAHKAPFRHIMLHGPPGTGKTLFSKQLAQASGLDYAIMTGGDFGALGSEAVTELHKVFDWAEASRKGTILFVDEADAFLQRRHAGMSEEMRNVLSAFLVRTGTESDRFMVVLATNMPHTIDSAVLDRIDEALEVPLPGEEERKKMLELYFAKYITSPPKGKWEPIKVEGWTDQTFEWLAKETKGFSGRQIAKFVIALQAAVHGGANTVLTPTLAHSVLNVKVKGYDFRDSIKATEAVSFGGDKTVAAAAPPPPPPVNAAASSPVQGEAQDSDAEASKTSKRKS